MRPGAIQIESTSDDLDIAVVALAHPQDRTLTFVLLNQATAAKSVSLSGPNLPSSFAQYRSSSSENCVSRGTLTGGSLSIPAQSVVTLVGDGYDLPATSLAGQHRATHNAAAAVGTVPVRTYGLDGRRVRVASGLGNAHAVYAVGVGAIGRAVLQVNGLPQK